MTQEKQPKALPFFFLTEMWERFGFYILEGLLIIYLTSAFGFSDDVSYAILGAFAAYVYITPIIGGYLADRVLGFRNAVMFGGVLLSLGYFVIGLFGKTGLYPGLALVILGNGFFKPNVSSFLGKFYQTGDHRRDSGYTFFYMGINLGIVFATLSSGFVREVFGWHMPFILAGIGLVLGVLTFRYGYRTFDDKGLMPVIKQNQVKILAYLQRPFWLVLACLLSLLLFLLLLQDKTLSDILMSLTGAGLLIGLLVLAFRQEKIAKRKMLALIILILSSIVFWAIFFQLFFSTNLFIERDIDRHIFGIEVPTVAFISLEAFFILLTGPILARTWLKLSQDGSNPGSPLKFSLAMFAVAIGFFILTFATHFPDAKNLINPWWIVFAYFFVTVGEMLLSPIGLSVVTKLSPAKYVGMMMGVWFIALGFGGKLAGIIATFASIPHGVHVLRTEELDYGHAFLIYGCLAVIVGIIMLTLVPWLTRLIRQPA